jgi:hypothetical protein
MNNLPPPPLISMSVSEFRQISQKKMKQSEDKNNIHKTLLLQNTSRHFDNIVNSFVLYLKQNNVPFRDVEYIVSILFAYDCNTDLAYKYILYDNISNTVISKPYCDDVGED